uniref:RING-type E3 ubiquitin transferase n=1 Tax=Catharus ustulatus TaxID=91951 RepID=A0A8C3V1G9_CATUS
MARGAEEARQESASAPPAGSSGGQREPAAAGLCPICLGDLDNAAHVGTCLHTFCFGCIRQWAAVRAACPLCSARPLALPCWGRGSRPSCPWNEHPEPFRSTRLSQPLGILM